METTHTIENLEVGKLYYFDSRRDDYGRYVGKEGNRLQFTAEEPGLYAVSRNGYVEFTTEYIGSFILKEKELNIKDLLQCIHQRDFEGMLEYVPEGIEHRGSIYKEPEDFDLEGSYEEDARYGYPARLKMMDACLELCIKELEK